ncbi:hypothetical protein [Imbroritus primus]|uniref:hypothetical protein n=1 Tax=Imbroritus primus TaxID=3058603 RepID=UPI003D161AD5
MKGNTRVSRQDIVRGAGVFLRFSILCAVAPCLLSGFLPVTLRIAINMSVPEPAFGQQRWRADKHGGRIALSGRAASVTQQGPKRNQLENRAVPCV